MTSTQPCRLHEWMTGVGELKTGLECPTLGNGGSSIASGLKLEQFSIAAPCSKQIVMGT
jgi:hypothetical protein